VTRDQLIARLWPKGSSSFDTSLNTAVRKLRIALNDDSENPR
jgi:DNA-binding winged helix-turn-helix (wHTH) protein